MKNEKAKFTPGPWEVDGQYIDTPGGLLLDGLQTEHKGERAANMALIAAAPELLAALEFCADALNTEAGGLYKAHIEQARAAIAKAKGE